MLERVIMVDIWFQLNFYKVINKNTNAMERIYMLRINNKDTRRRADSFIWNFEDLHHISSVFWGLSPSFTSNFKRI